MAATQELNNYKFSTSGGKTMSRRFIAEWIEQLRPVFPSEAEIELHEANDPIITIDWPLRNDPHRPNKRSKQIMIVISREAIEDCQDFDRAGIMLKKIVENRYKDFEPDHDHSVLVSPPKEEWIISISDLNSL